ncbi:MAG TPA: response regulator [Thermodesulfobacteriota bacterium]|nr:response regulator [Thermodesulfobacteriota bacterium]
MAKQILRERILMQIEKLPERQLQEILDFTENLPRREEEVQSLRTQNEKNSFYNLLIRCIGGMSHNSMARNIGQKLSILLRIILIADEDYRVRNLIRLMFTESMGYIVVGTSSGVDAILKAKKIKPDIILADVSLPDKNGYDISKEIKNDRLLKNTPVILLTSAFDTFNEKKILESHAADDIVVKPFEPEETIKKVESLLSKPKRKEIRSDSGLQAEKSYTGESLGLFKTFGEAMRGLGKCVDFGMLNPIRLSIANHLREFYQLQQGSVEDFKTVIRQIKDKKILNGESIKSELPTKDIKGFYKILNCYTECFKMKTLKLKGRHFLSNKTLTIIRPLRASFLLVLL